MHHNSFLHLSRIAQAPNHPSRKQLELLKKIESIARQRFELSRRSS